jgi:hypothetical protein
MFFHAILPSHCTHKDPFIVNFHVFWLFLLFFVIFAMCENASYISKNAYLTNATNHHQIYLTTRPTATTYLTGA